MKVAVTTQSGGIKDLVVPQFGRAPTFTIVELSESGEVKSVEVINNVATQQLSGAGVSSAQLMVDKGVKCVITGSVGPKAMDVLSSAGIKIYSAAGLTVEEAIKKLVSGQLSEITSPGGWGMGKGMGKGMGRGMGRRWM